MSLTNQEKENIQLVWNGMDAILKTKNEKAVTDAFDKEFIQHNPWAQDGIAHVKEMLAFDFGYIPVRWVADEDVMAYHGYYTAPNPLGDQPLLCVDAWRVEDGKIKEHWDALAPMPADWVKNATEGPGNGEKEVSAEQRLANKATVMCFLDHVLNRGRLDLIEELVADNYVYHHESEGALEGRLSLKNHILGQEGGRMVHETKMLLASGDLVMAHAHYFGSDERVVFDWFRMSDNGLIAEHWSVQQPITPLDQVANAHPHF